MTYPDSPVVRRLRGRPRRETVNTQGFAQPPDQSVARPEQVERVAAGVNLTDAPPLYKLTPYVGQYALGALERNPVRPVVEADLEEMPEFLPRYLECHPRCTPEGIL